MPASNPGGLTTQKDQASEMATEQYSTDETIAALQAEVDHYKRLAFTDQLTGIGNRAALDNAQQVCEDSMWFGMCDLNKFKPVNDTHGHEAGDRVLKEFAEFLATVTDGCWRLGGDEFVIAFSHVDTLKKIDDWTGEFLVTASTGAVPVVAGRGLGWHLETADVKLYGHKRER